MEKQKKLFPYMRGKKKGGGGAVAERTVCTTCVKKDKCLHATLQKAKHRRNWENFPGSGLKRDGSENF